MAERGKMREYPVGKHAYHIEQGFTVAEFTVALAESLLKQYDLGEGATIDEDTTTGAKLWRKAVRVIGTVEVLNVQIVYTSSKAMTFAFIAKCRTDAETSVLSVIEGRLEDNDIPGNDKPVAKPKAEPEADPVPAPTAHPAPAPVPTPAPTPPPPAPPGRPQDRGPRPQPAGTGH